MNKNIKWDHKKEDSETGPEVGGKVSEKEVSGWLSAESTCVPE